MSKEAFLKAILDDPDNDALRLVYADWLDEHGEPERAEFIRVQIELVHANTQTDPPEVAPLYAERWGDFDGNKHLEWVKPFFPVFE